MSASTSKPRAKHLCIAKAYGTSEGPLGFPMRDELAKSAEALLKQQSSDVRSMFKTRIGDQTVDGYCRLYFPPASFETKSGGEDGERTEVSLVTTGSVDRDREVVLPSGGSFRTFLNGGGVVTFGHIYDALPVGRALWVNRVKHDDPRKDGWSAKTQYHTKPPGWSGDWFADAVWHMVHSGGLKGKSIGFVPLDGHAPTEKDLKARPELAGVRYVIDKWEALEYAVAPVQSNPDALVTAVGKCKSAGITVDRAVLELAGLYLPGDDRTLAELLAAQDDAPPKKSLTPRTPRDYDALYAQAFKRANAELAGRADEIVEDVILRKRGEV